MGRRTDSDMKHPEFVERARGNSFLWGVRGFYRPVGIVWGVGGLLAALAVTFVVLAPVSAFIIYGVWSAHYGALIWTLPIMLAFLSGGPALNAIDLSKWIICALVGLVCGEFFGPVHLVGGLLPGLTWFLVGAQKGATMMAMEDRLQHSAESYERLRKAGLLIVSETR